MHPNQDAPFTWESKLAALQELGGATLIMHAPGEWEVEWDGWQVGPDHMPRSAWGEGRTPASAVNDLFWRVTRDLPKGHYIRTAEDGNVRWDSRNRKWRHV